MRQNLVPRVLLLTSNRVLRIANSDPTVSKRPPAAFRSKADSSKKGSPAANMELKRLMPTTSVSEDPPRSCSMDSMEANTSLSCKFPKTDRYRGRIDTIRRSRYMKFSNVKLRKLRTLTKFIIVIIHHLLSSSSSIVITSHCYNV